MEATAFKIVLRWTEPADAKDYKVYWDRGNNATRVLSILSATTRANTEFTVDHQSSAGIMGSEFLQQHGGVFRFQVSFVHTDGVEGERSSILRVTVPS